MIHNKEVTGVAESESYFALVAPPRAPDLEAKTVAPGEPVVDTHTDIERGKSGSEEGYTPGQERNERLLPSWRHPEAIGTVDGEH